MKRIAVFVLFATMPIILTAQTFTTLHRFDGSDGANPSAGLVQGVNGDLYGTTPQGGASGDGAIFNISPGGTFARLYSFCARSGCTDGEVPQAGLVQATNGYFYGTTFAGGANSGGTVFKINPSGTLTTLYAFCPQGGCTDAGPQMGLVQAANGYLYGTTRGGGAYGYGTIFRITPGGTLTTLYSFCAQSFCEDGAEPVGTLVQASNRDLYGATGAGGAYGYGAIFKITPSGTLTTLYSFCSQGPPCTDGYGPAGGLTQGPNGDLYGTTALGGLNAGSIGDGGGTFFKVTLGGTLTTLYSFCSQSGCEDGESPTAGLVLAANGDFYGTTYLGGANGTCSAYGTSPGCGTVFKITPAGGLTTLYSFCAQSGCADGTIPNGLVQATNGAFYGTTTYGANDTCPQYSLPGCGTIFRLSDDLGPFVETRPAAGEAGSFVEILGSDLTGTSSVAFNGIAASFTIVSRYLITTTVPAGASTGKVDVVTPGGTFSSNVSFLVP
jgi:uncharacterized repeat protein (TIGR03803 family)